MGRRERGGILRKETSCPWEGRRGVMSLDKGRELGREGGRILRRERSMAGGAERWHVLGRGMMEELEEELGHESRGGKAG